MDKSSSSEDYLKSILILRKKKGAVRSVDIAAEMGVTKASVCNAMKRLRKKNMVYFDADGCILFTQEGSAAAEKIYEKHLLLSKLLRLMGVNETTADREACLMEHAISDETYEHLSEYLSSFTDKGKERAEGGTTVT